MQSVTSLSDRLDDVVTERAPSFNPFDGFHRLFIAHDTAKGLVINIDQKCAWCCQTNANQSLQGQ
ncbi:hypothetical protein C1J03_03600 [Sulfitobacter sp. SK012]|nr:hypothetical protein C1J03_03600 [Sulfitobacter sp. SK012]